MTIGVKNPPSSKRRSTTSNSDTSTPSSDWRSTTCNGGTRISTSSSSVTPRLPTSGSTWRKNHTQSGIAESPPPAPPRSQYGSALCWSCRTAMLAEGKIRQATAGSSWRLITLYWTRSQTPLQLPNESELAITRGSTGPLPVCICAIQQMHSLGRSGGQPDHWQENCARWDRDCRLHGTSDPGVLFELEIRVWFLVLCNKGPRSGNQGSSPRGGIM